MEVWYSNEEVWFIGKTTEKEIQCHDMKLWCSELQGDCL